MKNFKIYFFLITLGAFLFSSCEKKDDWKSKYPEYTHSIVILPTFSDITDNSCTMSLTVDQPGIVYFLIQDAALPAPVDSFSFPLMDGVLSVEFQAAGEENQNISGLIDGTTYKVYTVFSNAYGAPGPIGESTISTTDETIPVLVDMSPVNGSIDVSNTLAEIVLTFSENVELQDASKIRIVDAFDESDLGVKGTITVSGNTVVIPITGVIQYLTDVAVLLDAGAVSDLAGNESPEYYLDQSGDNYALIFSIMDIINLSVFSGAYHCVANEVGFGNGIKEYDVILSGISDGGDYYIMVQNINDWTGSLVALTVDPEVDTCYFEEQNTGMVYPANSEDIVISSYDEYGLTGAGFKPGNFKRDGSEVRVFGVIYFSLGQFGFYEFTFSKINQSSAQINYLPPVFDLPKRRY
jgi:hypothetical protein